MKPFRISLRIVFYREDDAWIAHCLEFDVLGHGESKRQAIDELADAIRLQVEESLRYDNLRNLFSPADGELFEMFAAGSDVAEAELCIEPASLSKSPVVIESAEAREFAGDRTEAALMPA